MATRRYLVFGPFALLFIPFAIADNLTVDGKPYNGVYINETDSIYYVRDPSDGSMHSFSKSGSNVSGV